ncbi:unnamed protein product, partial [Urochloa humidicola]
RSPLLSLSPLLLHRSSSSEAGGAWGLLRPWWCLANLLGPAAGSADPSRLWPAGWTSASLHGEAGWSSASLHGESELHGDSTGEVELVAEEAERRRRWVRGGGRGGARLLRRPCRTSNRRKRAPAPMAGSGRRRRGQGEACRRRRGGDSPELNNARASSLPGSRRSFLFSSSCFSPASRGDPSSARSPPWRGRAPVGSFWIGFDWDWIVAGRCAELLPSTTSD